MINIPKKLEHFTDFEREAVVSDQQWLSTSIKVGDRSKWAIAFFPALK